MPWPVDTYHGLPFGATVAEAQMETSFVYVPELSPREMKGAFPAAMRLNAATALVVSLTFAGSAAGPTMTKSLYITGLRSVPKPFATKLVSAAGLWTSRTSASFFTPSAMASPEPTATTFKVKVGFAFSNAGMSTSKRPESSVEVVDARMRSLTFGAAVVAVGAAGVEQAARARASTEARASFDVRRNSGGTFVGRMWSPFRMREAARFPDATLSSR